MLRPHAQHDFPPRDAMLRPVFIVSLCVSAALHAVLFGLLPPFTDMWPWRLAPALEVTLQTPEPPPASARAEAAPPAAEAPRDVVAQTSVRRKPRPAVSDKARSAREAEAPAERTVITADATASAETAPPPAPAQEEQKSATIGLAPSAGSEGAGVAPAQRNAAGVGRAPERAVPPSLLRNPRPRYPLAARLNGEQGTVTLKVLVTQDGLPGSVMLDKTSGSALLDTAALQTVRTWRFVPARRGQQAVEAWVIVPVVFRLEDAS